MYYAEKIVERNSILLSNVNYRRSTGVLDCKSDDIEWSIHQQKMNLSKEQITYEKNSFKYFGGFIEVGDSFSNLSGPIRSVS